MKTLINSLDRILASEPSVTINAKKDGDSVVLSINLEGGIGATLIGEQLSFKGPISEVSRVMSAVQALAGTPSESSATKDSSPKPDTSEKVTPAPEKKADAADDLPAAEQEKKKPGDSQLFVSYFEEAREATKTKDYKKSLALLEKCLSCELTIESKAKVIDAIGKVKAKLVA